MEGLDLQTIIRNTVREYRAQEANLAEVVEDRNRLRDAAAASVEEFLSVQRLLTAERKLTAELKLRLHELARHVRIEAERGL